MKRIKWFESIDSYINASDKIEKNQVSFTFDTKQSWFTENYISARYVINSNYDSGGGEGESINTMDLIGTNVVGGREHYSRLIGSSNSNKHNINNKLQTYNEGGIDVSYSFNDDCECLNYVDDAFIIKERLNSLKFNVATDSYYYISVFAYNENISLEEYNNCNCTEFEFVIEDTINNGESYEGLFEIDENGQIYATQNGIDYMNQGISNGYKLVVLVYYDTIESYGNFQMIINDETILNVSHVEVNNYELQVLDYYETEILKYISEIHINGERQSEVAPYYYIMSETNEFDVKIVFNTSNIPSMHAMFEYCDALTCVDFKHLKLDKGILKDTSYMFSYCYSLIELKNLEYFDTSNVINMGGMFQECYSIGCANGRGLKPSYGGGDKSVDNLGVMPLSYNIQPYEIEQPEYNDSSSCQGGTIDIKHDNNCSTSYFAPTYDSYVSINAINVTSKLTFNGDVDENNDAVVCICISRNSGSSPGPVSLNASSDDDCEYIEDIIYVPLSSFTKVSGNEFQFNNNVIHQIEQDLYSYITHISFIGASYECMNSGAAPSNGGNYSTNIPLECCIETQLYCECVYCTFDLSKLNVSNVQNMSRMFQYCNSVHYINMSTWDTSNVSNMYQMFSGCESLLELDFSNWDMSNVYDSYDNFISNCYSLELINLNCKMNPNGFTHGSLYNIKENGLMLINEEYINYYPSFLFETLINDYSWNILSSQIDYQLTIVENGLEVTEGTVLCNGVELTYNSESNKWEGNITLDSIDIIITYNNIEYVKPYNTKYLFIGNNNNSYSGFNITLQCYSFEGYAYFMNSAYTKYIDYMLVDGVETSPNYFIKSNEDFKSYEIKLIFNLDNLTSIRGLFRTYIENEYDYDYHIVITSLTFENSFITTNIIDISNLCGNEFGLNIKLGNGFDLTNVTCADYAFAGCTINISNLNLDNLVANGTYYDMFSYSNVLYDCENEAQKTIVESSEEVDAYCNNIDYQLTIIENGLEVTEGTVLCNGVELSYNSQTTKWEGNITLDDFNVTILYNGIEHILYNKLVYLFIGNNNSSYEKINIIETCINNSNDYIKYIDNNIICEFVLLDGKQVNLLMEHMLYSNSININDNEEHTISLYVDTSNVTDMSYMFWDCSGLTSLDLSHFNTSAVTNMYSMFYGCSGLTSLDVSSFDTSKVTNMSSMFSYCSKLTSLDLSHFNTSAVINMEGMFTHCSGLTSLNVSSFDTSNVTDISAIFSYCYKLTSLDLSSFNTSNVTDISYMFYNCTALTSIEFGDKADVSNVTSYSYMFRYLPSNGTLTYPCAYSDAWDKLLVTNSSSTYFSSSWTKQCQSSEVINKIKFIENGVELTSGNVVVNNTTFTYNSEEQVWEGTYLAEQQSYPIYLNDTEIGITNHRKLQYVFIGNNNSSYSGFNITETVSATTTSLSYSLIYSSFIPYIDAMLIDGEQVSISSAKTFSSKGEHTVQMIIDISNLTNMSDMFKDCNYLTSIGFSDSFDTSNVTNMSKMFEYCSRLTSITFGNNFDTSNVTNMSIMFEDCRSLTSLDLSNFNTSKVTDMYSMFNSCRSLTSLDLSSFNTSKVTDMYNMFSYCSGLTSLDLSNFDTSKVNNMGYMFQNCTSLTSLDLSNFNTSKVTNMSDMFRDCYNLTSITFGYKANVSKVTSYSDMFYDLPSNLIFNYDCNYDYSKLLNYDNTHFNGYKNCITQEQTWLVKVYDYSTSSYPSDLTLTLSNGVQGIYDSEQNGYTFTFTNVKNVPTYDILMNNEVINEIRCDKFENIIIINLSDSYIKETVNVTSTTSTYNLISGTYISYINDMFIDGIKQDNIVSSYTFNKIGEHEIIYVVDSAQTLTSCDNMFRNCNGLTSLDLSNFDTSNVTSMNWMFYNCNYLTSLDLSNFDTSNVTTMSYMFYKYSGLTSLDLSSFDTSNVTRMDGMFQYCSLTSLDLNSFNTSKVNDMNQMFYDCINLTSITFGDKADVSKVTKYNFMFSYLPSNGTLSYPCVYSDSWDRLLLTSSGSTYFPSSWTKTCQSSEVTNKIKFIENGVELSEGNFIVNGIQCVYNEEEQVWEVTYEAEQQVYSVLRDGVEVGSINNSKKVNYIFIGDNNGSYSGFSITETVSATSTSSSYRLISGTYLTYIDAMFIDGVETTISSAKTFSSVGEHTVQMMIDTSNITSMQHMFSGCTSLTSIEFNDKFDTSNVTNMSYMFYDCYYLKSITFSDNFDTSNVTNMIYMFYHCQSLTSLDLSNFDTSNVTSMYYMFYDCYNLTSLDLSSFDTSNVISMGYMFYDCYYLKSLDLSNFDTSNVTNMSYMFYYCSKLASLDLTNFDTSNVWNMSYMFYGSKLTSLDLTNFDTSNVTSMYNMFEGCENLTSLDLSNFDTSKVYSMSSMFRYCNSLTSITFGLYSDVSKVTSYDNMFYNIQNDCILTLCSNVKESWSTLLSNTTFNGTIYYNNCL